MGLSETHRFGFFKCSRVVSKICPWISSLLKYSCLIVILISFLPLVLTVIVIRKVACCIFKLVASIHIRALVYKIVKYSYSILFSTGNLGYQHPTSGRTATDDTNGYNSEVSDETDNGSIHSDGTNGCDPEGSDETDTESIRSVEVQMYTFQTDIGESFIGQLTEMLRQDDTPLEFSSKTSVKEIKRDNPLLVICIQTSRLGADALNAIKGIPDPESSALLIFHHKDQHALPTTESARILLDSEFKKLYGIYDVACLTEKGVYDCEMNRKAVPNILKFIHHTHNLQNS